MTTWKEFVGMDEPAQLYTALEHLRVVVLAKGEDYVYERVDSGCVYVTNDGAPSCLIGHVLMALDGCPALEPYGSIGAYESRGLGLHRNTVAMLAAAQTAQDGEQSYRGGGEYHTVPGATWGTCLRIAEAVYVALRGYSD